MKGLTCLKVIAISMAIIATSSVVETVLTSRNQQQAVTNNAGVPGTTVLPVVARVHTEYDLLGFGASGFVVKDGMNFRFVEFDHGSRFDANSNSPMMLLEQRVPGGKAVYAPLVQFKN